MPNLEEMLVEELQDLLHAENQLVKALPKMAKAARNEELKQAFQTHLEETQGHVERLQQVFELLGSRPKAKPCKGMAGIVAEGQEKITETRKSDEWEADLGLIGAAQKVEHYEISGYGTVRTIAKQLGRRDVLQLLNETLAEEQKTDKLLTELAKPLLERAGAQEEDSAEAEPARRVRRKTA